LTDDLDREIVSALRRVLDPCSIGQHRPMSIYDLGLVRGWDVDPEGVATIHFCVTSPTCQMAAHFLEAAKREVETIPAIRQAHCFVDASVFWTPARMTSEGSRSLAAQRQRALANRPLPRPRGRVDGAAIAAFVGPAAANR
jgi:metal-sulfur cluster biosynthetic enzyme